MNLPLRLAIMVTPVAVWAYSTLHSASVAFLWSGFCLGLRLGFSVFWGGL